MIQKIKNKLKEVQTAETELCVCFYFVISPHWKRNQINFRHTLLSYLHIYICFHLCFYLKMMMMMTLKSHAAAITLVG